MITSLKVTEIDAKRGTSAQGGGFEVMFNIEDVKVEKEDVKIAFVYTAKYKEGEGYIKLKGEMVSREDKETVKKVEQEMKNKRLPADYMQRLVNTVNFFGTTNATVISTVLNVAPPIRMPNLQFNQGEGPKQEEKAKK
ncbi:MAG: hypothetical protein PHS02_02480 [Candidatus ainarchaeum sp.]|nr:hypothetical protein [Candidatus ainarchaeum sp.]